MLHSFPSHEAWSVVDYEACTPGMEVAKRGERVKGEEEEGEEGRGRGRRERKGKEGGRGREGQGKGGREGGGGKKDSHLEMGNSLNCDVC